MARRIIQQKTEDGLVDLELQAQSAYVGQAYMTSTSDTTTGNVRYYTVEIPNITEYYEGLVVTIQIMTAGGGAGCVLNINGLGNKLISFKYGTNLFTNYSVYSILTLTYTSRSRSNSITLNGETLGPDGFLCLGDYDTNTISSSMYVRALTNNGSSALYRYKLCSLQESNDSAAGIIPLSLNNITTLAAGNDTGVNTTDVINPFDLVIYYNNTGIINTGATSSTNSFYTLITSIDTAYTFNTYQTVTAYKMFYVVFEKKEDSWHLTEQGWSQDLPTEEDGKIYKWIGWTYSTTGAIQMSQEQTCFAFIGGEIRTIVETDLYLLDLINTKQDTLISGSNIATINGYNLLTNGSISLPNSYHTSGSWSGLTYTATSNGSAGALSFTIPTGSSSSTVSRGDHTHSNYATWASLSNYLYIDVPASLMRNEIPYIEEAEVAEYYGSPQIFWAYPGDAPSGLQAPDKSYYDSQYVDEGYSDFVIPTIGGLYNNWFTSTTSSPVQATSSMFGLVKLGSSTTQSVAANSVSATASRTYAIQKNSSGQLVVNVPWSSGSGGISSATLNGSSTTTPSWYAPTSSATTDLNKVLKSNGNGSAPTWIYALLQSGLTTSGPTSPQSMSTSTTYKKYICLNAPFNTIGYRLLIAYGEWYCSSTSTEYTYGVKFNATPMVFTTRYDTSDTQSQRSTPTTVSTSGCTFSYCNGQRTGFIAIGYVGSSITTN